VLDESGKQIGIIPTEEALKQAWDEGLDLVEIAPEADPPVAKILDFKKFLYTEKLKEKKAKKKTKEVELKEIRVGPFIAQHDLETRLEQAAGFLDEGNRVKITVKFAGRQMGHTEFGFELLKKIKEELSGVAQIEREEKLEGRNLSMTLCPIKKKGKTDAEG